MRLLLLVILILSAGCTASVYYKVPRAGKNYIIKREIVGYQCPSGMYLDMKSFSCQVNNYSGFLELGSTSLTIPSDSVVSKYDSSKIEVRRNE